MPPLTRTVTPLWEAARMTDWDARLAAHWATLTEGREDEFVAGIDALAAEWPDDDAVGLFERAAARDSTGRSDLAVPLYRRALDIGLTGERRRRAVIQLSSSLRNMGEAVESVALLTAERGVGSDELDDAVDAFLALALVDTGREREAVSVALTALARHLVRYQGSLGAYARLLVQSPDPTA
jgi:hypothetical protein